MKVAFFFVSISLKMRKMMLKMQNTFDGIVKNVVILYHKF